MTHLEELAKMIDTMTPVFSPILIGDNDFVVTFTKTNGEVRTMKCNFFKPDTTNTFEEVYAYVETLDNKDLITVFDLDANKFKSFYQTRVIDWEII